MAPTRDALTRAVTKSKVKKIADKRIDKAAPGLSVANAEALGGKPASDFASSEVEPYHEVGTPGEPGFQNGWVNFGSYAATAAFCRDPFDVVHLKGILPTSSGDAQTAFTLPTAYRPAQDLFLPSTGYLNAGVTIEPIGGVRASCGASPCNITLDGLSFRADG
jgi:hypothetical protein